MVLEINGVNIVPYIAHQGIKWQRSDLEGEDATRSLDGYLRRDRIASKIRLDITCPPLTTENASKVLTAIMPEWVTVRYTDPQVGGVVTREMYSNNTPATHCVVLNDGTEYWDGIVFPLIER